MSLEKWDGTLSQLNSLLSVLAEGEGFMLFEKYNETNFNELMRKKYGIHVGDRFNLFYENGNPSDLNPYVLDVDGFFDINSNSNKKIWIHNILFGDPKVEKITEPEIVTITIAQESFNVKKEDVQTIRQQFEVKEES